MLEEERREILAMLIMVAQYLVTEYRFHQVYSWTLTRIWYACYGAWYLTEDRYELSLPADLYRNRVNPKFLYFWEIFIPFLSIRASWKLFVINPFQTVILLYLLHI